MRVLSLSIVLLATGAAAQVVVPHARELTFDAQVISADGSVVAGQLSGQLVKYSTAINTVTWIGAPAGRQSAKPADISGDGSVIVGLSSGSNLPFLAWVWTQQHGFTVITIDGASGNNATCISRDGRVVGAERYVLSGPYLAYVWTREEGSRLIPAGSNLSTWVQALSADGAKAIGSGGSGAGTWAMLWPSTYLWSLNLGMPAGQHGANAFAATPTMHVVVGESATTSGGTKGFVWSESDGITLVSPPSPNTSLRLHAVTDDGNFAAGWMTSSQGQLGAVWRRGAGVVSADQYFSARGVSFGVQTISDVRSVSADGRFNVVKMNYGPGPGGGGCFLIDLGACGSADFNHDGDAATDEDIEAFFACIGGHCCPLCDSADFNRDGDTATDQDIEAFFRVIGGNAC